MILKPYQFSNLKHANLNFYLLYGQNEGQKYEVIQKILDTGYTENIHRYEEDEIFNNYDNFINELLNKSFFEDKKIM